MTAALMVVEGFFTSVGSVMELPRTTVTGVRLSSVEGVASTTAGTTKTSDKLASSKAERTSVAIRARFVVKVTIGEP